MSFTMRSQRPPLDQPMDFEFTSRPSSGVKPVWARSNDPSGGQGGDPSTPRKRPFDSTAPTTPFAPNAPHFGAGNNVPFIFEALPPQPHTPTGWAPPPDFSPSKAFPELQDVDMADASPPKPHTNMEGDADGGRTVSLGALKRVFRRREARRKATERVQDQDATDSESGSDDEEQSDQQLLSPRPRRAIRKTTSNHWTLNMPSAAAPQSELPALLLGYLQFFFNLSLVLVFLYLLLQFILTVQRDVEQKIAEHSLDIAQEISTCAAQYRANHCVENPIPAMARQCAAWEQCMARDPSKVGRARVSAELIAEVVNGFVEPISWKTLAFTLSSLAFLTLFVNTLLSLYRGRLAPPPPATPAHVPQTPGFPMLAPAHYGSPAPYGGPTHYGSPAPLGWQQWRPDEPQDAPSRRRRLEGGGQEKVR